MPPKMPAKVPSLKGKVGGDAAATPPPAVGEIATPRTDRSTPRSAGHVRLSDLPGGAGASNPTSPENVGDWDDELDRLQRARSPRVTPRDTPQAEEGTPLDRRSSLGGRSGGSQVLARRDEAESVLPRFQQSTSSRPSAAAIERTFESRPSSASSVRTRTHWGGVGGRASSASMCVGFCTWGSITVAWRYNAP